jgi:hypothetical protein
LLRSARATILRAVAIVFWALTAVNAMAGAVIFYFLVEGLGDGSVSADNASLWLMLVALPVATIGLGLRLKSQGRVGLAVLVLLPLALPALIYGLFLVMILVLQPDFR